MKRLAMILGMLLLLPLLSACGTHSVSTAADQVGLHYKGGPFSAKKYGDYIPASTKRWYGPGDKEFMYPINQRNYDATGSEGAESHPISSTSRDAVEMDTPLSVTFFLKTDEKTLREFHEKVGIRFKAYMKGDETSDGWRKLLEFYIRQALETTLDREVANYNWRDLYSKPEVRVELQNKVNQDLPILIAQQMGGEYFEKFSALVQKPEPTNQDLKKAVADAQNNVALANAARQKAEADLATARAQTALAKAEAAKKQAEIRGYGGFENYNKAKCVEEGCNPYQPTYVWGGAQSPPTGP